MLYIAGHVRFRHDAFTDMMASNAMRAHHLNITCHGLLFQADRMQPTRHGQDPVALHVAPDSESHSRVYLPSGFTACFIHFRCNHTC